MGLGFLGKRIRAARVRLGLTQVQLAEAVGVAQATVCKWERGQLRPDDALLKRLSSVLGKAPPADAWLRAFVHTNPNPMAVFDCRFRLITASDSVCRALGQSRADLEGLDCFRLCDEAQGDNPHKIFDLCRRHGFFSGKILAVQSAFQHRGPGGPVVGIQTWAPVEDSLGEILILASGAYRSAADKTDVKSTINDQPTVIWSDMSHDVKW